MKYIFGAPLSNFSDLLKVTDFRICLPNTESESFLIKLVIQLRDLYICVKYLITIYFNVIVL